MTFDIHDRVKVAYKKLKQLVYYEKPFLTLRQRLAEFECASDFYDRLLVVAEVASSPDPTATTEFMEWLAAIDFDVIPKSIADPNKAEQDEGLFISNVTSAQTHKVEKVNYIFDGPIEIHLLSVLWLMTEGWIYDRTLSSHCAGSRLYRNISKSNDSSANLFRKYHELYAIWRDSGIQKARELLTKDRQSVCIVGLDVQEYYYRIQLDWDELRTQIKRSQNGSSKVESNNRRRLGTKLFNCIEAVCKSYRKKLKQFLLATHPSLPDASTCLPIGLSASPVIANWYLKDFDNAVLEKVRPAYYGRYVDDILIVVAMPKAPAQSSPVSDLMDRILVKPGIVDIDEDHQSYKIQSRTGLLLQKKKCLMQYFDVNHSIAGLEKFQKQIEENASDFALLPVDGDDSPVAQVAYDLLYDGSVNKFRSVKAVAENRWELATHLAKKTQHYMMTKVAVDTQMAGELLKFFKGRSSIEFWDMWERVISFFVIAEDKGSYVQFIRAIRREISKTSLPTPKLSKSQLSITQKLRKSLQEHLDRCIEMSDGLLSTFKNKNQNSINLFRTANLIRHHLVAIPLLNYTDYQGSLVSPKRARRLNIDDQKIENSPRFVHFDECMGFIESSCTTNSSEDSVVRANELYKRFHGRKHPDISSELVDVEETK